MRHILSILTKNETGVISRVSNLFSGRGYSIESITASTTLDKEHSKITIVTTGDEKVIEQITKQLHRLIPIIKITEMKPDNSICHELMFVKIKVKDDDRAEIIKLIELFGAKILNISQREYIIQAVGDENHIKSLIELLKPIGIKEIICSGAVAIGRQ
ncbi:acetolactate synthase small subunit [bacterium]|nr:acetolactate synthase small subunit [bacterium]